MTAISWLYFNLFYSFTLTRLPTYGLPTVFCHLQNCHITIFCESFVLMVVFVIGIHCAAILFTVYSFHSCVPPTAVLPPMFVFLSLWCASTFSPIPVPVIITLQMCYPLIFDDSFFVFSSQVVICYTASSRKRKKINKLIHLNKEKNRRI